MLKKVKMLDYDSPYTYAPSVVDAVLNLDEVSSAKPTEARGYGPFVLVKTRNGETMTIVGTVDDLLGGDA